MNRKRDRTFVLINFYKKIENKNIFLDIRFKTYLITNLHINTKPQCSILLQMEEIHIEISTSFLSGHWLKQISIASDSGV